MIYKLVKPLLICIIIINLSCNDGIKGYQYRGFEKNIDVPHIKSLKNKVAPALLHFKIPVAESMQFDYNNLLNETYFVKLEKTRESSLTNVDKVIISKDRIIVADNRITRGIYIFDSAGKYINRIIADNRILNQKMLISNFLDFAYDYKSEEIILHDQNKSKMYYFDKNGEFKKNAKEYVYFENFANIANTEFYLYVNAMGGNSHIPALQKSTLYLGYTDTRITNTAEAIIKSMRPNVSYSINTNPSITNSNDNLFYTPEFSDTVYKITAPPLSIAAHLVVSYPASDINSVLKATHKDNIENYIKLTNSGQFYAFTGEVLSNNVGIHFINTYKGKAYGYFYSQKTNKVVGGDIVFKPFTTDTLLSDSFAFPTTTYQKYFVSILNSSNLKKNFPNMSPQLSEFKKTKLSGDNPVLFFYTLKSF